MASPRLNNSTLRRLAEQAANLFSEVLSKSLADHLGCAIFAGRLALQDSMKRFDASRGKPVANDPPTESRPLGHDDADDLSKDLLH